MSIFQDGVQDGRRISKMRLTSLMLILEEQFWCLTLCFGGLGIQLADINYSEVIKNCKIKDG